MLILIIAFLIIVIGWPLDKIGERKGMPWLSAISATVALVVTVCLVLSSIYCIIINIEADANFNKMEARYENLSYQINNDYYSNIIDLNKRELMEDIREYNEEVAFGRSMHNNIWLGVFYPVDYDNLKFIELPQFSS